MKPTTDESEIFERLSEVFADVFGEDVSLSRETTAADVDGWDSIRTIELVVAIEGEFGLRFNTGEIAGLENVGQLVDRIASAG